MSNEEMLLRAAGRAHRDLSDLKISTALLAKRLRRFEQIPVISDACLAAETLDKRTLLALRAVTRDLKRIQASRQPVRLTFA